MVRMVIFHLQSHGIMGVPHSWMVSWKIHGIKWDGCFGGEALFFGTPPSDGDGQWDIGILASPSLVKVEKFCHVGSSMCENCTHGKNVWAICQENCEQAKQI